MVYREEYIISVKSFSSRAHMIWAISISVKMHPLKIGTKMKLGDKKNLNDRTKLELVSLTFWLSDIPVLFCIDYGVIQNK